MSLSAPGFVKLLKECAKRNDISRGSEIHAEVARTGLHESNVYVGTALVDMYAKCGLLSRAQQVFDKLPDRNIVTWTALIGGYVDNDQSEKALWYFECMQGSGIPSNSITFICCLKACCTVQAIEKGQYIHSQIEMQGLLKTDIIVANALVDMYAKNAKINEAHYVLSKLPARNDTTWKGLIAGYLECGLPDKALYCFEQMQRESVAPSPVTYVFALKACGSLGNAQKGQEIHRLVEESGMLNGHFALASSLICMYSKCGLLVKACDVFDRVSVRNNIVWNSLLGEFAENGHSEEVLRYYELLKLEGVHPNNVTFLHILNACGNTGDASKGREIHEDVERQGMLEDPLLGSALVNMFAKSGCLHNAEQVFNNLGLQSVATWNALITGYAECGQGRKALNCLEQMEIEGVLPMPGTFICALKCCSSTKNLKKSKELHSEVERRGLVDGNMVLGNTLVDMYAKFGLLFLAQEVLDRLPARDVATWSMLIAGFVEYGFPEEALSHFQGMQSEGIAPNAVTYKSILKCCCFLGLLNEGQQAHAEIERQGLVQGNCPIGSTLIDLYSKCGSLVKAEEVFSKLPDHSIASWNALIEAYAEHDHGEIALQCIEQMQQEGFAVEAETFVCALKASGGIGCVHVVDQLYAAIEQRSLLDEDVILGSTLIEFYVKCGSLQKAQQVFKNLLTRDVVSWTTVIAGCVEQDENEEALKLFKQMYIEGVSCDAFTIVSGLKACGNAGASCLGKQIHVEIKERGLLAKDPVVGNALVDMYGKCGLLATAQEVSDKLPARSVISWTSLIAGYCNFGYSTKALTCLYNMQTDGFSPNVATYVCSLKACANVMSIEKGVELHAEIERQGLWEKELTVGSAIVDMYAQCGKLTKAQEVCDKLPLQTTILCTAIMAGYARIGEGGKVFNCLERMLEQGLLPNEVTFVVLLTACTRMGLVSKGVSLYHAMSKDFGIAPVFEHYTSVVSLFAQAGHLDKILPTSKLFLRGMDLVMRYGIFSLWNYWRNVEVKREYLRSSAS